MTKPESFGNLDLSRVKRVWDLVTEFEPRLEQADTFNRNRGPILTARGFDEAQGAGRRTYIVCGQLFQTAIDHQNALQYLVSGDRGITASAPWTLMRSTFEASLLVHWILEPNEGTERRRRGLKRTVLDHKQYKNWRGAATNRSAEDAAETAERNAKVEKIYRDEADELGAPWDQLHGTLNFEQVLPKLDVVNTLYGGSPHLAEVMWRQLSGHAHGYGYAAQASSKVERSVVIPCVSGFGEASGS